MWQKDNGVPSNLFLFFLCDHKPILYICVTKHLCHVDTKVDVITISKVVFMQHFVTERKPGKSIVELWYASNFK